MNKVFTAMLCLCLALAACQGDTPTDSSQPTKAATAPPTVTQAPSQSLQTQTALNEVSGKQTRLNMELGAKLDRTNADFLLVKTFAGHRLLRLSNALRRKLSTV